MNKKLKIHPTEIVKGCNNCPFRNYDNYYAVMYCNATGDEENDWVEYADDQIMTTCPLEDGQIDLKVKKG